VLREDEKPGYAEEGGVSDVYGGIQDIKPGKSKALEGRPGADMWSEEGGEDEGEAGVDVHAELDWGEIVASEKGKEAVEAGDFVE